MTKPKTKIPITVLTGFLGAGKTTLLNYILTNNYGLRFGVIVNDFGDINIDSKMVAKKTEKTLELSNGCICCSLETLDLQDAISQFVTPKPTVDYILIEASGLAEPRDLALNLKNMIGLSVKLDGIICILDAENLIVNATNNKIATDQLEFCDFVIINKIDLVSKNKIDEITQLIRAINPKARLIKTSHGKVELHLLLDQDIFTDKSFETINHNHGDHAHHSYQSLSFSTDKPLHPMRFQEFVNKKIPTSVFRAKGIIDLGQKGHLRKYIFQLVGVRAQLTWDNWRNEKPRSDLVFIGQDFDKDKLKAELKKCIDTHPDEQLTGLTVQLPKKAD